MVLVCLCVCLWCFVFYFSTLFSFAGRLQEWQEDMKKQGDEWIGVLEVKFTKNPRPHSLIYLRMLNHPGVALLP